MSSPGSFIQYQCLTVKKESTDGFYIAEKDPLIRGPGEMTGTKQSGFLRLHYASLTEDLPLIELARTEADRVLENAPTLLAPEHAVIRRALAKTSPFALESVETN